ncbi:MAG: hypothetical protein KJ792_07495 [Actinobacteria bacterium]|nr:hypothetical protein [Actinomycetota bacterium]MCG2801661.1 hypothetical protein [Cellulomonas sp.]
MHRIASVAVWMSLVFASVVAFQLFVAVDEAQPAGTQRAFKVVTVDTPTKAAAIDAIAATARELHRTIYKVQPDPRDSMQGRVLFAFVGDEDAFESHGGYDYPAFSTQATTTRVVPADTLSTEDLRGTYVTDAGADQMTQLLAMLDTAGITARDNTVNGAALLVYSVGKANLAGSFAVMAVALGLAVSYSVARNRKVYALKALHGYRRMDNLRTELVAASTTFGLGAAGLLAVGLPLLGIYNHFRQAPGFLRVWATTILVLYVALVALVVLAVSSLPRGNIPTVLKGEQVALRNGVLAASAQIVVLAIVAATTSAAMSRVEAIHDSLDVSSRWSQGDPLYALRLSVAASTHDDEVQAGPGLAAVIADMETSGHALLVQYQGRVMVEDATIGPTGSEPLIVNNGYLERQVVNDADGGRITDLPGEKNDFTLLIPTSYTGDPQALLSKYVDYFKDFACLVGRGDEPSFACDPKGTITFTAPGQDLFTYNGTAFLPAEMQQDATFLHDPVVVVVPAASELISPLLYVSYASQDNLLFSDPAALDTGLQAHGVRGYFQGIDNAADAVTTSVALAQRELRMDTFSLVLGWAVLILSSVVMVIVYCDRRKRPMFVGLIHGYSFASRHWGYLTGAVALSGVGIAIAGLAGGSLLRPRDVATAIAFVIAQVAIALAAIRIYETRFRADFIKRY